MWLILRIGLSVLIAAGPVAMYLGGLVGFRIVKAKGGHQTSLPPLLQSLKSLKGWHLGIAAIAFVGGFIGAWLALPAHPSPTFDGSVASASSASTSVQERTETSTSSAPTTNPSSESPPWSGPRVECPQPSNNEPANQTVILEVVKWCVHHSFFTDQLEVKIKPRITNGTDHTIDVSLRSWYLVISSEVDPARWTPVKDVKIGKPISLAIDGVPAWGIPANADGRAVENETYASFATHWNVAHLDAGKEYVNWNHNEGDIVWWIPFNTLSIDDGEWASTPDILGIAIVNNGSIVAYSGSECWDLKNWDNPNNF